MDILTKKKSYKKRREVKIRSIYSRCLITKKIFLPMNSIGKNLNQIIEENIRFQFEGKCLAEGYIKTDSSKIITYSSGCIERGNNISFVVVFECDVCFTVEGMLIPCIAKNITKAGIRAESANEIPSPIIVFIAKDHHFNVAQFSEIKEGDNINVKVIGQRFELNDKYISIIAELVKEKDVSSKPKIVIEED